MIKDPRNNNNSGYPTDSRSHVAITWSTKYMICIQINKNAILQAIVILHCIFLLLLHVGEITGDRCSNYQCTIPANSQVLNH
jgi:hypothetical protein